MQLFTEIVNVWLGSKYASVIINLMPTSATQLCSKTTKINEIFIGVPHFILKLGQKLRNKFHHGDNTNIIYLHGFIFRRSSLTAHKDKFMSNESRTKTFCLVPNVTNAQKIVSKYPQPWSCDSEIISPYILSVLLTLTWSRMSIPNYRQNYGFLESRSRLQAMLIMYK